MTGKSDPVPDLGRSVLSELTAMRHSLDAIASRVAGEDDLRVPVTRGVARAMEVLVELEQQIWELRPDLVPEAALPRCVVDLDPMIQRTLHPDALLSETALRGLRSYLPPEMLAAHATAASREEFYNTVCEWWTRQKKPYLPGHKIYTQLRSSQRWRRYAAAKALSAIGVEGLWMPSLGDVSSEAVERWYQDWCSSG